LALHLASEGQMAKVFLNAEGERYLIATLISGKTDQVHIDVNTFPGQAASLTVQGAGEVHATGLLTADGVEDFDEDDEEGDEEGMQEGDEEEDEEEDGQKPQQQQQPQPKKASHPIQQQGGNDEDEDEDDEDQEDEGQKQPSKPTVGQQKRPAPSQPKSQPPAKQQKTETGKAPAKQQQSNTTAAVPAGGFKCVPCGKAFTNQGAFEQHNKAKHQKWRNWKKNWKKIIFWLLFLFFVFLKKKSIFC